MTRDDIRTQLPALVKVDLSFMIYVNFAYLISGFNGNCYHGNYDFYEPSTLDFNID